MGDTPEQPRRRSRRRATSSQGPPKPAETQPETQPPPAPTTQSTQPKRDAQRRRRPAHDAGLRDLVGSGHSQLGVGGALRGRDVNRPTEQDLADAERDVVIVRRHWAPKSEA